MKREYSTPFTVNYCTSPHWSFYAQNHPNINHSGPGFRISTTQMSDQPLLRNYLLPNDIVICCRQRLFFSLSYSIKRLVSPTSFYTLHSRWSNPVQFPQTFAITTPSSELNMNIQSSFLKISMASFQKMPLLLTQHTFLALLLSLRNLLLSLFYSLCSCLAITWIETTIPIYVSHHDYSQDS